MKIPRPTARAASRNAALSLVAAAVLLSCSSATEATPALLQGAWAYSEILTSSTDRQTCAISGTLTFLQEGNNIGGTYIRSVNCSSPSSDASSRGESGPLGGGRVEDSAVRFDIKDCRYQGVLSTVRDLRRLSGTVLCLAALPGVGASGAWQADEIGPDDNRP